MITEGKASRPVRLNPFSFPSNIDFFFALIVVAVLAASTHMYQGITVNVSEYTTAAEQCLTQQEGVMGGAGQPVEIIQAASNLLDACMVEVRRQQMGWILACLFIELALAGLIYWFYPAVKIRRQKLALITRADYPELLDVLERLSSEMGLLRPPRFYLGMYDLSQNGQAFGRAGAYALYLPLGLMGALLGGSEEARAVVLHELGHIKNADIDKTYLTIALWYAFILTALAPYLIRILWTPFSYILETLWRSAAMVVLLLAIRNAVLRSREYYADLRASLHEHGRGGLRQALQLLPGKEDPAPWKQLAKVHPAPAHRLAILEQPGLLFQQSLWTALATGIIFAIAYDSLGMFFDILDSAHPQRMVILTALIFSPLVVSVIGLGLWRSEFAHKIANMPGLKIWKVALVLTAGIFLGRWISLTEYINRFVMRRAANLTPLEQFGAVVFDVVWVSSLAVALFLFFKWVKAAATAWLEVALRQLTPRKVYLAGLAVASLMLTAIFGVIFYFVQLGISGKYAALLLPLFPLMVVTYYMQNPAMMALLVTIWAFPLASLVWLNRAGLETENRWALLDSLLLVRQGIRLAPPWKKMLGGAAAAALICTLLFQPIHVALQVVLPDQWITSDNFKTWEFYLTLLFTWPFQAAAAAWCAAHARELRLFFGQSGAFLTGVLCGLGFLLVNLIFGGSVDPYFAWLALTYTATAGQIFCLLFSFLAARRRGVSASTRPQTKPAAG